MTQARAVPALASLLLAASSLAGCMVGPTYHRPTAPTPPAFKEADGWSPATPSDAANKSDWWTAFGDPVLSDLEVRVATSNQTLAADAAAYRQAHYLVLQDRAGLFPSISLSGSANDSYSGGRGGTIISSGAGGVSTASSGGGISTSYQPSVGGSWAPDLWGSVRRTLQNAKASAQASAATLANAQLSLQTELATDYINLRQLDEEKRLYDREVSAFTESLKVVQNQYDAGNAARSALLTAQSTLRSAQATDTDLARQRAIMEHAIAILVGSPPADFTLAPASWNLNLPQIPATVPSTLLQRRPDIASAERAAAAANAEIGVQTAAFFPNVSLTGDGGGQSSSLSRVLNAANLFWTVGASASETVFDAGLRLARVRGAQAAYDASVATYRQTVLTAFGQVEDNLAAQRVYGDELVFQKAAAEAAVQNQTISLNEYKAGTVDYTTVAAAQSQALAAQVSELATESGRLGTAVALIEALGGGWNANQMPKS